MKIDVVIVNWNAGVQLLECVDSVIQYGQPFVGQVIVVDNGSSDGSESAVENLPGLTLIRAGANLGFGKACNVGATHANAEYLLFLNPDARLFADSLAGVLDFMVEPENAKVGICGVQLIDEAGQVARSCARFPSVSGVVAHATGLERLIPVLGHTMNEWDHATTREVDQVIGAFFLIRQAVFQAIQGFDERFFVYFEEVDASYRARQLGWSSVYFADAQAFHAGCGSSRQIKAKRLFYSLRSRILYAFKHFNPPGAAIVLFASLFIEPLSRSALALGRCSWAFFKETWLAYGMLFCWLPEWVFTGRTR